jgi:hypothetical protein
MLDELQRLPGTVSVSVRPSAPGSLDDQAQPVSDALIAMRDELQRLPASVSVSGQPSAPGSLDDQAQPQFDALPAKPDELQRQPAGLLVSARSGAPGNDPQSTAATCSFAFDELGVFGRHGVLSAEPSGTQLSSSATPASRSEMAVKSLELSPGAVSIPGLDIVTADPLEHSAVLVNRFVPTRSLIGRPANAAAELTDALTRPTAEYGIDVLEGGASVGTGARCSPARPGPVNLVVLHSGNGLVLLARSSGLSGEDLLRMRRLFESTAREFGMNISELHVNGDLGGYAASNAMGGANGGHTG